jgi:hypothetical protein
MIEVFPVGKRKGTDFFFPEVHGRIIDLQRSLSYEKSGIAFKRQCIQAISVNLPADVIPAKAGKIQVRLSPEHGVESSAVIVGVQRGQRPSRDKQAFGEMIPRHLRYPESGAAHSDHRINSVVSSIIRTFFFV